MTLTLNTARGPFSKFSFAVLGLIARAPSEAFGGVPSFASMPFAASLSYSLSGSLSDDSTPSSSESAMTDCAVTWLDARCLT